MKKAKKSFSKTMNKKGGKTRMNKKKFLKKKTEKRKSLKRKSKKLRKKNPKKLSKKHSSKVMKGGAIPFSELNPSTLLDHGSYQVKGLLQGTLIDNAQSVPNNPPHNVNPSVLESPYINSSTNHSLGVAGNSPDGLFAETN